MKNKIIIYPTIKEMENRYVNNLYKTIMDTYEVKGYDEIENLKERLNADIYHFNWIESENEKGIKRKINYIKKIVFIEFLKIKNKKIIWTVHNNVPHEIQRNKTIINFMRFMAKKSDKIHILCNETINNEYLQKYKDKIVYIPHGDYINNYEKSNVNIYERYKIGKDKKIMLFIGQVKKYKNIELLIKAFKDSKLEDSKFLLLICGKCNDKAYKEELEKLSNKNILFDFNFIKDEEMEAYLRSSQIVVAPYNKESSLNSGTLWMCMSYSKTMILPLIGCIKDIKNYDDFLYTYDYEDEKLHYDALLKCLLKVKLDINTEPNILDNKGIQAYEYIVKNQTWKIFREKWGNLYKF